jgi:spermidine synthase
VAKRRAGSNSPAGKQAILLIFLLSGFAGLVYEVVWARQLVLVFGNTTQAISAILTGFFGGMALGSVIGGRIADRVRSPLRMYAILELLVVVAVLLTPVTFGGLHEVYRGAFGMLQQNPTMLALVRFGLSILALGPATVLMGATLPTLSRQLVRDHTRLGREFGELYLANTTGAIYGALISGIFLIELIGLNETLLVGAACSGTAGLAALLLNRRIGRPKDAAAEPDGAPDPEPTPAVTPDAAAIARSRARQAGAASVGAATQVSTRASSKDAVAATEAPDTPAARVAPSVASVSRPRLALALAFVSGLTSLGYQNLWNRLLASGTGSTSYVFTSILIFFLAGIAVGAYIFSRFLYRTRHPVALLGIAELGLAVLVLATLGVETCFFGPVSLTIGLVIVVAPATLVMGIVFPMSSMLVADSDERVGTSAGLLLGSNTLGAICGSFVVPFFLMPILSSPRAVVVLAAINALTGFVLLWQARSIGIRLQRVGRAVGMAVAAAALAVLIVPNQLVADPLVNRTRQDGAVILSQAEDEIASVQAVRLNDPAGSLMLSVAGTGMTTLTADTRMMAHLPLMIRPQAKSMCVIAFGMGSSYRSALIDGLRVDAVELVPSVPDMFGRFYSDANQVRANPNGHIYVADGRNYVQLTTTMYDLLIVDPPPPMDSAGTGVLFSQEFYKAAKARLNSSGVMMEWEFNGQTVDEFRSHVKTFKSVFKHVTLAFGSADPTAGVMMLGSDDPIELTPEGMQSVLSKPGVVEDLSGAPDSPPSVKTAEQWQHLVLDNLWISDSKVDEFGASGTLITDDHPYTEYNLLRHLLGPSSPRATRDELLKVMPKSTP